MRTFKQFITEQEKKETPHFFIGLNKQIKKLPHFFIGLNKKPIKKQKEDLNEERRRADRIVGGLGALHDHLSSLHSYQTHIKNSSEIEKYSIDSSAVNRALIRAHKEQNPSHLAGKTAYISSMDEATRRVPTQKDMVVHSGVGFSPAKLGIPEGGKLRVHLPAYTSTSIDKKVAHGFPSTDNDFHHSRVHVGGGKFEYRPVSPEEFAEYQRHLNDLTSPDDKVRTNANKELNAIAKRHGHVGPTDATREHFERMSKQLPKYGSEFHHDFRLRPYGHMISVHVPKGSHGLYMGNLSVEEHQGEKEFVLPRDSQVEIGSNPRINHEKGVVEWRGSLVHDGVQKTSLHPDNN